MPRPTLDITWLQISIALEQTDLNVISDPQAVQDASGQLAQVAATVPLAEVGSSNADQLPNRGAHARRTVRLSVGQRNGWGLVLRLTEALPINAGWARAHWVGNTTVAHSLHLKAQMLSQPPD
jgi:hypothetical protein